MAAIATKIAISIPKDELKKVENIRKKLRISRSAVFLSAVKIWFKNFTEEDLIKQYIEGYQKNPESISSIKALEKVSTEVIPLEKW